MAETVDIAKKAARMAALNLKAQNGTITPTEKQELSDMVSGLMAKPGKLENVPPKPQEQVKAEYEAMKKKAAAEATASGVTVPKEQKDKGERDAEKPTGPAPEGQSWVKTKTGWVLAPAVKPEEMQINPALPTLPGWGQTPSGEYVKLPPEGQTGKENPNLYSAPPAPAPVEQQPTPVAPAPPVQPKEELAKNIENNMKSEDIDAIKGAANTLDASKADPNASADDVKKATKSFTGIAKELASKYGIPILAIIQSFAYGQAGYKPGTVPTIMDKKYQEKLDAEQKEYAKKLEEDRRNWEASQANLQIQAQADIAAKNRAFQADQAELDRLLKKEELGKQLTSEEKIARMQLEGRIAAAKTSGPSVQERYGGE